MANWKQIQAEYIEGNESIDALAKKYGVNPNTARSHFRKEHWTEKRQEARRRADEIMIQAAADARAELAAQMDQAALLLLESIIATLQRHADGGYTRMVQTGENSEVIFDLVSITRALVELACLYGFDAASQLDRERLELKKPFPEYENVSPYAPTIIEVRPDRDDLAGLLTEDR